MIVSGTGGHALELWSLLKSSTNLCFFNDAGTTPNPALPPGVPVLQSEKEARAWLKSDPEFVLGTGKPSTRKILSDKLSGWGGKLCSVISDQAIIGTLNPAWGKGLNIMPGAIITEGVQIGEGTLIHVHCSIHHNVSIGSYCEISPGCRILGGVRIDENVSVGAGAILLPAIHVARNVIIGAGAVVTRHVPENTTVVGTPARPK